MSVSRWIEVAQGRGGDGDEKGVRNYTRTWKVITDDRTDTPSTIFTYSQCPVKYQACPWDAFAVCIGVTVRNTAEDGDSRQWEVTAKYSSKYDDQQQQNPLDRPVRQSLDFNIQKKPADVDKNGTPVTNSAGDAPSSAVEIEVANPIFRFVRNEATLPIQRAIDYQLKVNSDAFYGAAPGTCRLTIRCGEQQTENGVNYYQVTYEVEYRSEGWAVRYLNEGFNTRTAGGNRVPIAGAINPVSLVRIGENGVNGPQAVGTTVQSATPAFCKREMYDTRAFSSLGL